MVYEKTKVIVAQSLRHSNTVLDFRKQGGVQALLEMVESFKFISLNITNDVS